MLTKQLIENNFIDLNTNEEIFLKMFTNEPLADSEKIIWLPVANKRKVPNKLALSDLFILLIERKLLEISKGQLLEILPAYFMHKNGQFSTFTYSNLPSETKTSEHYQTLKRIVFSL
jgi:hypothetical protein